MHFSVRTDPVSKAKRLVATGLTRSSELARCIEVIWRNALWQKMRSADGASFGSFPEFVTAAQPHGLGITTQDEIDELGVVLHKGGLYGVWQNLLDATTRKQGRPKRNIANNETKVPYFKLPTSHTARAKQVMLLAQHHPVIFADLVSGQLSLKDAVGLAGLVKPGNRRTLRLGVFDPIKAVTLGNRARRALLEEVFMVVGLKAQCHLLANVIEPATDTRELARRWRAKVTQAQRVKRISAA